MLSVPSLDLLFHALFPLLDKESLLIDLFLYLLLAVDENLVNLDHHDFEHVIDNERGDNIALVATLDSHELLDELKDFEIEYSQVRYTHL
jgi:hypothetical protein